MDQQDHEQLEVEDEDQRRRRRLPFPVKYLTAITKLMTSTVAIDEAAAAAFRETLGDQDATDEDLAKLEVLVKQCLHELEEERLRRQQQQPHDRSIILRGDASTSTTDDHSGSTSTGNSNEDSHGGGGLFQKQVPADHNEIQVEEEEEAFDVPPKLQGAFVRFPLFPRRSYGDYYSPERLMFSNVVDDLDTICIEAAKSYFFEEVVQRQINQVTSRFTNIGRHLRDLDAYTKDAKVVDIEWLKVVTNAAIETKTVIADLIVKTARGGGSSKKITRGKLYHPFNKKYLVLLFFLNADYRMHYQMKNLMKSIKYQMHYQMPKGNTRRSLMNAPIHYQDLWEQPTSGADPGHVHIVGREKDKEIIRKHLMSTEKRAQVISVVGKLGTGKTALAHQIYSQYSVVRGFDIFAWAQFAGGGCSPQNIRFLTDTWSEILNEAFQQKIIDQMHQVKKEMDNRIITTGGRWYDEWYSCEIVYNVKIFDLLRNHRYLIIIDDIPTIKAREVIRIALPMSTMNRSRILLTTRDTRVALQAIHDQAGSPPPHQLGPLSDAESWELFNMKVRPPSPLFSEMVSISKEIVKKCDGLPFAIEHLADHLSTQETTSGAWSNVLESAHKIQDNYDTPWSYVLNMIVKDLSLNLKWCLFYFGLFPKNYAIPVRRLIALWVAEGFVEQRKNKTLEYLAEEYLQELINLNMVQVIKQKSNGRPKRCCLTYYLREHLSTRGKQTNYASTSDESSTSRSAKLGVSRLADHPGVNRAMESPDSYRFLLSFLSFDYREGYEPGE